MWFYHLWINQVSLIFGFWFFWRRNVVSHYFYIWQFSSAFFNMIKLIRRTFGKYAKPLCHSQFWLCISWLFIEAAEIIGQWIFVYCAWSQNGFSFRLVKSWLELIQVYSLSHEQITLIIIVSGLGGMTRPSPQIFVGL